MIISYEQNMMNIYRVPLNYLALHLHVNSNYNVITKSRQNYNNHTWFFAFPNVSYIHAEAEVWEIFNEFA